MKPSDKQLVNLIVEITGKEAKHITDAAHLRNDLSMDSISLADLLASLEEDYELVIEVEDVSEIETVGQLKSYVKNL